MKHAQSQLTVRTATDILDVVPTLLGFIPTESLVVIYLDTVNGPSRIAMTARIDLPTDPAESTAVLQMIIQHAQAHDSMVLVAYSVESALADNLLLALLGATMEIEVQAAISATPEGWADVETGEPVQRHPYPDGASEVAADIVAAGLQHPQGTRDDLAGTIGAPSAAEASRFANLLHRSKPIDAEQIRAWVRRWTDEGPARVLDAEAAILVVSIQNIEVRDAAWAAISCADAQLHIDLWRQIARLVDGPASLPVLGLLGMAAWVGGQGALANIVLDRTGRTAGAGEYSLFELLEEVLRVGLDPRSWDGMRETLAAAPCSESQG